MKPVLLLIALMFTAVPSHAQARSDCPRHPTGLAAMRDCYRPLLVFAPDAADPRLQQQQLLLDSAAGAMAERDLLYLPALENASHLSVPLHAPSAMLPEGELTAARKRLHVAPGAFQVVLLGMDGGVKLSSTSPVSIDTLNSLIDAMPMRQREMQQPHDH